jgi:hypothetical protein
MGRIGWGAHLAAALAAAGLAASAPAASNSFNGKVCSLLGSADVTALDVVDACTPVKTAHAKAATIWGARWGNSSTFVGDPSSCDFNVPSICFLAVQVWKPKSASWYAVFKKEAQTKTDPEDVNSAVPKLGSFARANVSVNGENLFFLVHGYGVVLYLKHRSCSPDPNDPQSNICTVAENLGAIGASMTAAGRKIAKQL